MLRIGLSGTNWTRKTTTIQQAARALNPVPIEIISLSSFVRQCPFPMGREQTLDGSKWMVDQIANVLARPVPADTVQIFDRTPLDILAFTLYAAERAGRAVPAAKSNGATGLIDMILSLGTHFMLIFVCRPGGEWPAPESPPAGDVEFATFMNAYLTRASEAWATALQELPWSAASRVDRITKTVSNCRDSNGQVVQ